MLKKEGIPQNLPFAIPPFDVRAEPMKLEQAGHNYYSNPWFKNAPSLEHLINNSGDFEKYPTFLICTLLIYIFLFHYTYFYTIKREQHKLLRVNYKFSLYLDP